MKKEVKPRQGGSRTVVPKKSKTKNIKSKNQKLKEDDINGTR